MSSVSTPAFKTGQMPMQVMLAGMIGALERLNDSGEIDEWGAGWAAFESLNWAASIEWKLKEMTESLKMPRFGSSAQHDIDSFMAVRYIRNCSHHNFAVVLESTQGRAFPRSTAFDGEYAQDIEWRFVLNPVCNDAKNSSGKTEFMAKFAGQPARIVLDDVLIAAVSLFGEITRLNPSARNW